MKATFILLLVFIGCRSIKPIALPLSKVDFKDSVTAIKLLRFDGAYQYVAKEDYHFPIKYKEGTPIEFIDTPFVGEPIIFFRNGNVLFQKRLTPRKEVFLDWISGNYLYQSEGWGTYNVEGNIVTAIIYINFKRGSAYSPILRTPCIFEGNITDPSAIENWRMIPPYPTYTKDADKNEEYANFLKESITVSFKPIPEIGLIQPLKAWLNN